jgi:hypothetical protein
MIPNDLNRRLLLDLRATMALLKQERLAQIEMIDSARRRGLPTGPLEQRLAAIVSDATNVALQLDETRDGIGVRKSDRCPCDDEPMAIDADDAGRPGRPMASGLTRAQQWWPHLSQEPLEALDEAVVA